MRTYSFKSCLLAMALAAGLSGCHPKEKDPVLARVGPEEIREAEFLRYFNGLPSGVRSTFVSAGERRQLLMGLIQEKGVVLLARAADLEPESQAHGQSNFSQQANLSHLYVSRLSSEISVSNGEVRAYYEGHAAQIQKPYEVVEEGLRAALQSQKTYQRLTAAIEKLGISIDEKNLQSVDLPSR